MPWQRLIYDVGGEYEPATGLPAYREIICTVPRQSGKTSKLLVFLLERAILAGRPTRGAYTAQTGLDARLKLVNDLVPVVRQSPLSPSVAQVLRGAADTAVNFTNGSRWEALTTASDAGHGKTFDIAVIDEAFADDDDRREQALLPAMATRPDAQLLVFSTAGTEESVYLRRKVDAGRAAVEAGHTSGIAYFEWSAPEDADPDDEEVWRWCMPALGYTITLEVVRHARQTMSDGEFRRALLNQWVASDTRVIPAAAWVAVSRPHVAPQPPIVFAADATPDRQWASVAVADAEGRAEVVSHGRGAGWVLDRVLELAARWKAPVALDSYGPLSHLGDPLEARKVEVRRYGARDLAGACGNLFDRIMDGQVEIREHGALNAAAAAARKRAVGDAWAWTRRTTDSDISPLVAVTLALDAASAQGERKQYRAAGF